MKLFIFIVLLSLFGASAFCQTDGPIVIKLVDSLKVEISKPQADSVKRQIYSELAGFYVHINSDSALFYGEKSLEMSVKLKDIRGQIQTSGVMCEVLVKQGDLPRAVELALKTIELDKEHNPNRIRAGRTLNNLAGIYLSLDENDKAIYYYKILIEQGENDLQGVAFGYIGMASVFEKINKLDSALIFLDKSHETFDIINASDNPYLYEAYPGWYNLRAKVYLKQNKVSQALSDLHKTLAITLRSKEAFHTSNTYNDLAAIFKEINRPDSSRYYAEKAISEANKISYVGGILSGSKILAELYETTDSKKALHYFKLAAEFQNKLYGAGNIQTMRDMIAQNEEKQRVLEAAAIESRNRIRQNTLLGSLFTLLVFAIFLFRNNRMKQKSKLKIESAYNQLKSTQSQLIQSEKMASLGELTAGIAHEIQNPLNFVNNFSEVSEEMIDEMNEELNKGEIDEAKAISGDLKQNLQKIYHHGQRASGIVKGMLEHSRTSDGKKELTDINALADEYLRLAYHGLRAKNNSFNSDFKMEFDESLPKVEVVPQDIGRVLLNLINNAFFAVNQKAARHSEPAYRQTGSGVESGVAASHDGYQPEVTVSTKVLPLTPSKGGQQHIEISIKDNGAGIPEDIKDKIFQPFFTTKPTGSGTGLGLSLSYDIVKAHGGELKVESKEGEGLPAGQAGSEFIIILPIV